MIRQRRFRGKERQIDAYVGCVRPKILPPHFRSVNLNMSEQSALLGFQHVKIFGLDQKLQKQLYGSYRDCIAVSMTIPTVLLRCLLTSNAGPLAN